MTKHTPVYPGAMTPAQMARKCLDFLCAVGIVAVATAVFVTLCILFI